MTEPIYRVTGHYRTGRIVSHLVGAPDAYRAVRSVMDADPRITCIANCVMVDLDDDA